VWLQIGYAREVEPAIPHSDPRFAAR